MIEFVGNGQVWGFPIHLLYHFSFGDNPEYNAKETRSPDQLILDYPTAAVTLLGWRLDMMIEPLCSGRIVRVRAVPEVLAGLTVEEPWVTEIHFRVVPLASRRLTNSRNLPPCPRSPDP